MKAPSSRDDVARGAGRLQVDDLCHLLLTRSIAGEPGSDILVCGSDLTTPKSCPALRDGIEEAAARKTRKGIRRSENSKQGEQDETSNPGEGGFIGNAPTAKS
jgi:hypothetical protein